MPRHVLEFRECFMNVLKWQEREGHQLPDVVVDGVVSHVRCLETKFLALPPDCLCPVVQAADDVDLGES